MRHATLLALVLSLIPLRALASSPYTPFVFSPGCTGSGVFSLATGSCLPSVSSLTTDLTFASTPGGGGNHNVDVAAAPSGDTGDSLTLRAGASSAGGTDQSGGTLILGPGLGTGAGSEFPMISFELPVVGVSSGTGAQTYYNAGAISMNDVEGASINYPTFQFLSSDQSLAVGINLAAPTTCNNGSFDCGAGFVQNGLLSDGVTPTGMYIEAAINTPEVANTNGGYFNLISGQSEGTGTSGIMFYGPRHGASGTGINAQVLAAGIEDNELRLYSAGNQANYIGEIAPASGVTSYTTSPPPVAPAAGQVRKFTSATASAFSYANVLLPFATGALTTVGSNEIVGSGYAPSAMTVSTLVGAAATFTCSVNPTFKLLDCGTSAGACTSGTTTIGTVTLTAAGSLVSATPSSATITAGHYWAWQISAGTCTVLNATGSAAAY